MTSRPMRERTHQLRMRATPFEQALWRQLCGARFDQFKFRRRQIVGVYIVHFICLQPKLIIELGNSPHLDLYEYDAQRDAWLHEQGFRIVRVWNRDWLTQRDVVLEKIWMELQRAQSA